MSEKTKKFIHSKTFLIILIIVLMLSVITAGVYAWLTWSGTNKTNLTMKIGKIADVTFPSGPEINTSSLTPVFNYTDGEKITFSIYNKSTTSATINYKVVFNITTLPDALKDESFKYVLVKVDTSSASNDKVVKEGTLKDYSSGSSITLVEDTLTDITADYAFYVYIDANIESNNNMIGKTFVGNITVSAEEKQEDTSLAYQTIKLLNLQDSIKDDTPNFSTVSGNNGEEYDTGNLTSTTAGDGTVGIYKTEDEIGTSYYFRGAVENNYVYFANYYWRIIRINGDGTVRIIYAGQSPYGNGYDASSSPTDVTLYEYAYSEANNDNTYVGYVQGSVPSPSYEEAHNGGIASIILQELSNFMYNNLNNYIDKISSTFFCNDRSADNFEAYGEEDTEYNGFNRMLNNTPSLKCTREYDRLSVTGTIPNVTMNVGATLSAPIGLITADEMVFAGNSSNFETNISGGAGKYYISKDNYLYNNVEFWTMTPARYIGEARVFTVGGSTFNELTVTEQSNLRPVISLKNDAIISGTGTIDAPFTVE